jgi:hypothetical protein
MPWAPAGETAPGSKLDSARSWAASRAAETFQRAAERASGTRNRAGTNDGSPPPAAFRPSLPPADAEHGSGPREYP